MPPVHGNYLKFRAQIARLKVSRGIVILLIFLSIAVASTMTKAA